MFPKNIHDLRERLPTLPVGSIEWHQCIAYNLHLFFHHEKVATRNTAMQLFRMMEGIWKNKTWLVLPENEPKSLKGFVEVYTGLQFDEVMAYLQVAGKNAKVLAKKFQLEAYGDGIPAEENGGDQRKKQSIQYTPKTSDKLAKRIRRDHPELWQEILDEKRKIHSVAIELGYKKQAITIYASITREEAHKKVDEFFDKLQA